MAAAVSGAIPKQGSRWDERRNTSRVFPVPAGAAERATAITRWASENPRHAAWLTAGAPPIRSDAEHLEWFGEPYTAKPRRVK
jgi:hypothetical protein